MTRLALLVVGILALTGCPQRTAIWIVPGSTRDSLVFALGDRRGHEHSFQWGLRVDRCEDPGRGYYAGKALWSAWVDHSKIWHWPTRVTYGVAGEGIEEPAPATLLSAGCYLASTNGTGDVAFTVDSTGGVVELDSVPSLP